MKYNVSLKRFKGLVHPQILSLITRPHVVPNPQDLRSSSEHQIWALRDPP